jgi:hypothetical protein
MAAAAVGRAGVLESDGAKIRPATALGVRALPASAG